MPTPSTGTARCCARRSAPPGSRPSASSSSPPSSSCSSFTATPNTAMTCGGSSNSPRRPRAACARFSALPSPHRRSRSPACSARRISARKGRRRRNWSAPSPSPWNRTSPTPISCAWATSGCCSPHPAGPSSCTASTAARGSRSPTRSARRRSFPSSSGSSSARRARVAGGPPSTRFHRRCFLPARMWACAPSSWGSSPSSISPVSR